jgi:hypothetical protein
LGDLAFFSVRSLRQQALNEQSLRCHNNTKDKPEGKAMLLKATIGKIPYLADWAKRELAMADW